MNSFMKVYSRAALMNSFMKSSPDAEQLMKVYSRAALMNSFLKVYPRAASSRSTPEQLQVGLLQSSFKKVLQSSFIQRISASQKTTLPEDLNGRRRSSHQQVNSGVTWRITLRYTKHQDLTSSRSSEQVNATPGRRDLMSRLWMESVLHSEDLRLGSRVLVLGGH
ncbi:unnamed protein product [Arctogadus glacialis]